MCKNTPEYYSEPANLKVERKTKKSLFLLNTNKYQNHFNIDTTDMHNTYIDIKKAVNTTKCFASKYAPKLSMS